MEPALWALLAGIPSFLLGVLAYRKSVKVDAVAAQAGVATESRAGTAQVIEGLNRLIDNLQEDNEAFRGQVKYLTERLDARDQQYAEARQQLVRLHRKYGENGANGK